MAGDHFPNKYFPDRFFPGTYFQGGEIDPNAMSASITASASLTGSLVNGAAVVPVPLPTGTTGGGGSNLFYIGKYRGELRRTIKRAMRSLDKAKPTNGKKKKVKSVRRAVKTLLEMPDLSIIESRSIPPKYKQFEEIKLQISSVVLSLKIKEKQDQRRTEELKALLEQYELEVKKIEREEEEQALIVVMALLAA